MYTDWYITIQKNKLGKELTFSGMQNFHPTQQSTFGRTWRTPQKEHLRVLLVTFEKGTTIILMGMTAGLRQSKSAFSKHGDLIG